jgi:hypothetical protein
MRKINEENERIKRRYLQYLKVAKRKDPTTVLKAAEGILRFEATTGYASFKRFRIEQAIKFQERLNGDVNTIDYVTIASAGNATDFGDVTAVRATAGTVSNAHGGLS